MILRWHHGEVLYLVLTFSKDRVDCIGEALTNAGPLT
jgi:hypothetical protein